MCSLCMCSLCVFPVPLFPIRVFLVFPLPVSAPCIAAWFLRLPEILLPGGLLVVAAPLQLEQLVLEELNKRCVPAPPPPALLNHPSLNAACLQHPL